jgi:hypothetical protein
MSGLGLDKNVRGEYLMILKNYRKDHNERTASNPDNEPKRTRTPESVAPP